MIKESHNYPTIYEISYQETNSLPVILLRIHQDFVAKTKINLKNPIAESLMASYKFKSFSGDLGKNFGFNENIFYNGIQDEFSEFSVKIPEVKKISKEKCDFCKGSGKDEFDPKEKCDFCQGTGKNFVCDWTTSDAISASLTVLLREFEKYSFDNKTSSLDPQLISLITGTAEGMDGCFLSAEIGKPLRWWLAEKVGKNTIPEMIKAMKATYWKTMGYRKFDETYFSTEVVNQGGLILECPPGGCSMVTKWDELSDIKGYSLYSHACDNSAQQLTFIAGLAALYDLAKQKLY